MLSLFLMACQTADVQSDDNYITELETQSEVLNYEDDELVDEHYAIAGRYELVNALVSFLREDGSFDTIPTTIVSGELSEIEYVDGDRPSFFIDMRMVFDFRDNGEFVTSRYFNVDEIESYEMDVGKWWLDDEYLNIETYDRRLFINYETWSDGSMFIELDRENPQFIDSSCLMSGVLERR